MVEHRPPRFLLWGLIGIAVVALIGGVSLFVASFRFPDQPLSIVACTPGTYVSPITGQQGPPQRDCERWFSDTGDSWDVHDPIPVVGQVCNSSDDAIAYQVEVAFASVVPPEPGTVPARVLAIDTPVTYDPGCSRPYSFAFDVPPVLARFAEENETAGRWKISGTAVPADSMRYESYRWDVTGSVELVDGS